MARKSPVSTDADPSLLKQVERQAATQSIRPISNDTVFPQATQTTSGNAVTITQSLNNDSGDVVTVYSGSGTIAVTSIDQTINQYNSVDSGVSQIIAGENIVVSSSSGNGLGIVTISSTSTPVFSDSRISNGTSNVEVSLNGPVTVGIEGVANKVVISNTALTMSGTIVATNANLGNAVRANFFIGDGGLLSNVGGISGNANYANFAGTAFAVSGANVTGTVANATFATSAGSATTAESANTANSANIANTANTATIATTAESANTANTAGFATTAGSANTANTATTATSATTAESANTANTVTSNAQSNITSLGSLTGLTVVGVTNLGDVGNVSIIGGSNGQVLTTNGSGNLSWTTVSGGGVAVISNGTSYANVVANDGNVVIGVAGDNMTWTFATDRKIYGKLDTDVQIVAVDDGEGVGVRQVVIDSALAELSRTRLEESDFYIQFDLDSSAKSWRFDNGSLRPPENGVFEQFNGNIRMYAMDAGSNPVASLQSVSNANDPNIFTTFDATPTGANISVYNGGSNGGTGYTWAFDNSGNVTLPRGGSLYSEPAPISGNMIVLNPHGSGSITNQKLMVYPTLADGDHLHLATGNLYETELFLGTDDFYVKLANTGDVVVNANDSVGNTSSWTFGANGTLTSLGNVSIGGSISGNSMAIATQLIMGNGTGGSITGAASISTDALSVTGNANVGNIIFSDATVQNTAWTGITPGAATLIVDPNGDDLTATGSVSKPFETIQAAHDYAVTNIASSVYLVIQLNAGNYSGDVVLTRPKTAIVGASDGQMRSSWIAGSVTVNMTSGATALTADIFSLENVIVISSGSSVITLGGDQRYVFFSRNVYGYTSGASTTVLSVTNTSVGGIKVDLFNTLLQSVGGGTVLATTNTYYLNINQSSILANSGPAISTTTTSGIIGTSRISTTTGSNVIINVSQFAPGAALSYGVCSFESAAPNGNGLYLISGSATALGGCAFNVPAGSGFAVAGQAGSVLVKSANNNQIAYNTNGNTQGTVTVLPMSYL